MQEQKRVVFIRIICSLIKIAASPFNGPKKYQKAWSWVVIGGLMLLLWGSITPKLPIYAADPNCTYVIPSEVTQIDGTGNYAQVRPGDTLCLPAGTRDNLKIKNLQGTAEAPVVIRNSGGRVQISGQDFLTGGLGIINSGFVRITGTGVSSKCGAEYASTEQECGIEIGPAHKGMKLDTRVGTVHHIEIDHVSIHDTSTVSRTRGIAIHPVEGQLITELYIHHNYIARTSAEGIYLGTEPHDRPLDILGKLEDVEVSYNLVEETDYDGIKLKVAVKDVRVHHNVVRNVGLTRSPAHEAGIKATFSVGVFYNNFVDTGVEGIVMGRTLDNPGTKYYNNVIVGAQVVCLDARENGALVYNNTLVNCGNVGISATGNLSQVYDNIVVDTVGAPIQGEGANIFNNLVGSSSTAGFVNPAAGDYHLLQTSPALNAGRADGIFPAYDYDDVPRPQGSKTDLGAYEYAYVLPFKSYLPFISYMPTGAQEQ